MIRINTNSKYNSAPAATINKVMKRFSMFDGIGLDLTGSETYDDALQDAGIDYTAEKKPLFLENGTLLKDNFAVVKSDDENCVLGVVGNQYTAVSNRDAFDVSQELLNMGLRYETGGPSLGSKNVTDYARTFLVMRGDDFEIGDDEYNSFVVFNNSFDGSSGVQYSVICQRLVCLNGMVRYLGGAKDQLRISIQHSKSAVDRIKKAQEIVIKRQQDIEMIKREAEMFIGTKMNKDQFVKEVIPVVLKKMNLVEKDKDRQRGHERIERTVMQLMSCYNADDTQNYNDSAYKIILALSDFESHAEPLRNTGNRAVYMNRITKGMLLTGAAAQYIASTRGLHL